MSDDHKHPSAEPAHGQPGAPAPHVRTAVTGGRRGPGARGGISEQFLHRPDRDGHFGGGVLLFRHFQRWSAGEGCHSALGRPVVKARMPCWGPGCIGPFPRPIDEVRRIPFTEIQTVKSTTGWYYMSPQDEAAKWPEPTIRTRARRLIQPGTAIPSPETVTSSTPATTLSYKGDRPHPL